MKLKSLGWLSVINGDITIKIPEYGKYKVIMEIPDHVKKLELDEFDILAFMETLFEGLSTEQQTNMIGILQNKVRM